MTRGRDRRQVCLPGYTRAVTPLPLCDAAAHLPHEAAQLRQLPLQVLGHLLLPFHFILAVGAAPLLTSIGINSW